jgi:hypothetical protein
VRRWQDKVFIRVPGERRMREQLRGMLGLDAVVPVVLIAAAVLMTLEPTIFGAEITEWEIVLGFFGFLGIDALVERTGRLNRIERRLEALASRTTGPVAPAVAFGHVPQIRTFFDRQYAAHERYW